MASTPHDGSGTTFSFRGTNFTVTNITYNLSDVSGETETIDISHLGLTTGASLLTQSRPLKGTSSSDTGKEVSIDYIGSVAFAGGVSGAYSISGGLSLSGNATCVSSSVTLAVNDVIKGSASFRLS
jgi:hypothetical protein